ncbi:membrane protein [Streptomyces noursei ATCC 11455]|nr:membrane protein [Streptomyces noursei ATCC 11455]
MFCGKHRDTGFNLQVAATLAGDLLGLARLLISISSLAR